MPSTVPAGAGAGIGLRDRSGWPAPPFGRSAFRLIRPDWLLRSLVGVYLLSKLLERRVLVANVCAGIVLACVLAVEVGSLAMQRRVWWLDCLAGVVICGLALARGRSRMWSAAAGLAVGAAAAVTGWLAGLPGEPGVAAALALMVLMAAAIRVLPVVPAVLIAAGGAVLVAMMSGFHPDLGIGAVGSWWGLAVAAGLLLRLLDARRRATLNEVRRAERMELARELHDVAAHHMTGVVLQAQAARIAARTQPATLDSMLADIESATVGALDSMRRVIGLLRDGDAAGLRPGPEQLPELVGRFAGSGVPVALELPDGPADPSWPPEVMSTVYRVVLEALTNVLRHAPLASQATVTLRHDRQAVTVDVTDDAPPAPARPFPGSGGYGLTGMRERVEALGGVLRTGQRPGGGWSVRATVPLRASVSSTAASRP
jgi:signal transduction histidine kinase